MIQGYIDKFIIFLIVLFFGFVVFLQISTTRSTEKLKSEEIAKAEQYVQRIASLIQNKTKNSIKVTLGLDQELRESLNETLNAFLTSQYRYIFLLSREKEGQYRFLLDGTKKDAEEYQNIFFPESKLFDDVYKYGKMQIIEQTNGVEDVWLSFVYPIMREGKTEALLVLELSSKYAKYIKGFNSPLVNVVHLMQWLLGASLFLLLFLAYRYHMFRNQLSVDSMTGAYTKYYMNEFLNKKELDAYHAILIDIDNFKSINQKYQRSGGDIFLSIFSKRIVSQIPKESKLIRTGGTEFLILTPKNIIEDFSIFVYGLYESLRSKPYYIENDKIYIGLSVSAIEIPRETQKIDNILRLLDNKILEIKKSGKNNLGILTNVTLSDVRYTSLDYIKEALDDERFICMYQPIYDAVKNDIVKFEALVRMQDKESKNKNQNEKKYILPKYFLHSIRCTSQYIRMSKLVLHEVFKALQKYPTIQISMNLDLDDLDNVEMIELIQGFLETHKHIASRLTFEIIEENEIKNFEKVNKVFRQLRSYGSKIAIDDFGSGYANYTYLSRLDIDILKLDAVLVQNLKHEPLRGRLVLESIIDLADKLGYEVVAEFVSSEEIYTLLKEMGIVYMQGYYLGKPKKLEAYIN